MHNTCFFPDCHLLAVTAGSISIPYLAGYSEIFKKPNFQVVKMEVHVHLKNAFQAELETEGSRLAIILGLPPTPQHVPRSRNSQKWRLFRNLHNTEQQENPVPPNVGKKEGQGKGKKIEEK